MAGHAAVPPRWSRVIVTRPAAEAGAWVAALQAQGWETHSLPLIDIGAPRDPQVLARLRDAQTHWSRWDALMFVSTAAVHHFFDGVAPDGEAHGASTRFWAPGPGTARALSRALQPLGLGPDRIDQPPADAPQFDSEHLWPVVSSQARPGARVLVVRGLSASADGVLMGGASGSGREWLIEQCRARGAEVDTCTAYERHAHRWSPSDRVLAAQDGLWLFSSSEAVAHLRKALPATDWSRAAALCTHERIAAAALAAGFVHVYTSRPSLPDVLVALESVQRPT